jgi:hypothetical protein
MGSKVGDNVAGGSAADVSAIAVRITDSDGPDCVFVHAVRIAENVIDIK